MESMSTHILIAMEACGTDLGKAGFDTFPGPFDGVWAVLAQGTAPKLEALLSSWPTKEVNPDPWPAFTAYQVGSLLVHWPKIVRMGVCSNEFGHKTP
jgi:hypothetical protein